MALSKKLSAIRVSLKHEVTAYRLILEHARTPLSAKILLGAALGYLLLPFDLIPDFIPVLGHLDDVIVVSGLVYIALQQIPPEIVEECRQQILHADSGHSGTDDN